MNTKNKPGSTCTEFFGAWGIQVSREGCSCKKVAGLMDRLGSAGTLEHINKLTIRMKKSANEWRKSHHSLLPPPSSAMIRAMIRLCAEWSETGYQPTRLDILRFARKYLQEKDLDDLKDTLVA